MDWKQVVGTPEFDRLVASRRRFVLQSIAFACVNLVTYVVLVSWAPEFMTESIYEGLTVGYVISIFEIVLVSVLAWLYIRKSAREWAPLTERIVSGLASVEEPGTAPEGAAPRPSQTRLER